MRRGGGTRWEGGKKEIPALPGWIQGPWRAGRVGHPPLGCFCCCAGTAVLAAIAYSQCARAAALRAMAPDGRRRERRETLSMEAFTNRADERLRCRNLCR